MRKVKITVELPQSAELSAELVTMIMSEQNEDIKAMLEAILDQLRADYAKNGIEAAARQATRRDRPRYPPHRREGVRPIQLGGRGSL